jgi:toxin-antitoxin system PIN domain toxin
VIVPDVNLLVYAYDTSSRFHPAAARWWSQCLSGAHPVGLTHPVLFGFLRITTSARIFERPMTLAEADDCIAQWLARGVTQVLLEDTQHAERAVALLNAAGSSGGNLVTDAQIAALAQAHNGEVHTADRDFLRFPRLSCRFPLDN